MTLTDLVVVEVVSRCDLDAAGAELRVDVLVGDNRYQPAGQRQTDRLADQVCIAAIVRVNGDGRVAEHRLRPRRGDDERLVAIGERVAKVPELGRLFGALDLEIGNRRV
jgi:hypothetical protein